MHLQFIGCGDAFGSGGRFSTCFHLVGRRFNGLIECGASSLVGLNKLAIDCNRIDFIVISHFHADHAGGLPFFILEAKSVLKRKRPLTIVGPRGLRARLSRIMETAFPGSSSLDLPFPLHLRELAIGKPSSIGGLKAAAFHVAHNDRAGPCLGFRFDADGKVIAYSGDTQWTDTLIEIGKDADLFICECYGRNKPSPGHMTLATLERKIDLIRCKRLVLTHMGRDMLKHRGALRLDAAEDGMIIEL